MTGPRCGWVRCDAGLNARRGLGRRMANSSPVREPVLGCLQTRGPRDGKPPYPPCGPVGRLNCWETTLAPGGGRRLLAATPCRAPAERGPAPLKGGDPVMEAADSARPRRPRIQPGSTEMRLATPCLGSPYAPARGYARARTLDDVTVVELHGEIDIATVHLVASVLDAATAAKHPRVLVDFAAVTFIDCSGLGQIARAWSRARNRSGRLALACTSVRTLRVLRAAGLIPAIPVMMPEAAPLRPGCCAS